MIALALIMLQEILAAAATSVVDGFRAVNSFVPVRARGPFWVTLLGGGLGLIAIQRSNKK